MTDEQILRWIRAIRARKIVALLTTLILGVALLAACTDDDGAQGSGQRDTEEAFERQRRTVPYPKEQLNDSLERRNLRERLLRFNDPNKLSYIYLLSETGGIYAYFTVKGKVTSTQSQMTTGELAVRPCTGCDHVVVNAPGDDGSYGPNEDGIFFFTTSGAMVTWNGPYLWTDAPLRIDEAAIVLRDGGRGPTD